MSQDEFFLDVLNIKTLLFKWALVFTIFSYLLVKKTGFWIRIQSGQWIRIRIRNPDPDPGGQKLPTKGEKIHVLKCWMASYCELQASSVTWTYFMKA